MKRFLTIIIILSGVIPLTIESANMNLGFEVGLVNPEGGNMTVVLGGFRGYKFNPQFVVETGLDFWKVERLSDICIGGTGKYILPLQNSPIQIFFGGGIGIHMVNQVVSWGNYSYIHNEIGFHFLGGIESPLSETMSIFGEFKIAIVNDMNIIYVTGGLNFAMPTGK